MATEETFNGTSWKLPEDPRKEGMKYPHYNIKQSPSGSGYIIDDTKDMESVTYFHRSGSMIQFQPDGSIVIINKKNRYDVNFGDNNVLITGAQNITVNGGGQLKVEGDYDMTVNGNLRTTVKGNIETVCDGDVTEAIKGNKEVAIGENSSQKVGGNSEILAAKMFVGADDGLKIASSETQIQADGAVKVSSADLTHNNINVGDDHKHSDVMSGGDQTGNPVG